MTTDSSSITDFSTRKLQVQNMLCTKIVFCFDTQNNNCTQLVLNLHFSGNLMNNLLSYCGLPDARMRASKKDLPVLQCTIRRQNVDKIAKATIVGK